jgi:hypothetical protein
MENPAWYVYLLFAATVVLSAWLFLRATRFSKMSVTLIVVWTAIQSALALSEFYNDANTMTGRFPLLVAPPVVFILFLFLTKKGRTFVDSLDIKALTLFHIVRIPVEITLLFLFIHKAIPKAMTFEGHNFDILSGLSAPVIFYFVFVSKSMKRSALIVWNIACILLLLNVVTSAVLSLPGRYLQFGFEQPNVAVGFFPFVLLPALVVPLALFSNVAAIVQLLRRKNDVFFK